MKILRPELYDVKLKPASDSTKALSLSDMGGITSYEVNGAPYDPAVPNDYSLWKVHAAGYFIGVQ